MNYIWQDKYIINLTIRRDGSSRFGGDNRYAIFGAVGGAWIFSEESFIKNNFSFLSFGKLRGSYGTTGSDQIGDYNLWASMSFRKAIYLTREHSAYTLQGIPNPQLKWERTQKLQSGIDIGLLQEKILISATYARNRSSNQLLGYSLPFITGVTAIYQNFPATIQNTNWEFAADLRLFKTKNFFVDDRIKPIHPEK